MPRSAADKNASRNPTAALGDDASSQQRFWVTMAVIVVASLAVRVVASRGDFWIDEIWSVNFAREATSPADIFRLRVDNNHLLNTLILHLERFQSSFWVMRMHSVLAGAASVALAGLWLRRWAGSPAAVFAMILLACSYIMVNYGSEARGYAMQVMFLLAALLALDHGLSRRSWVWAVVFWICCAMGFLSHALFLHGYAAMLAWSAWSVWNQNWTAPRRLLVLAMFHAVPMACAAALYVVFLRHLQIAGAVSSSLWITLRDTASFALGLPRSEAWGAAALVAAALIVLGGTFTLWRKRLDTWVFFITACVIAPALVAWASSAEFLLPRYFLIPITCLLLLASALLGFLWTSGVNGRAVAVLLVVAFIAANSIDTRRLIEHGRGHYLDAMRYIVAHSADGDILIAGDHDKRESTIVDFYKPYLHTNTVLQYVPRDRLSSVKPQWMLLHRWEGEAAPPEVFTVQFGQPMAFERRASFEASPLGGWRCYVYERISP